jgi:prepilin-type N-terminal cleavage/methylation domain-containing protein
MGRNPGFTLVELLVVVAVLATLAVVGTGFQGEMVARMEVEAATRRVLQGLERGRSRAERQAQPCALSLQPGGWAAPTSGTLPSCFEAEHEPPEGLRGPGGLQLEHNLPEAVRFSSNGLVLDGGTVVLSHGATPLSRCVVVSLPLGITRVGLHSQAGCRPDPNL